ncbi:MAG: hypothetical protein RBT70_07890 [Alphaproteobacteria bacterium]|nr:hypothetical protein [Alphaproteobacteria bacterium]
MTAKKAASKGIGKDGATKTLKRRLTPKQIEKQVREVLIALLDESESDSVRVAAAKALMDRLDKTEASKNKRKGKEGDEADDDNRHRDEEESAAALAEACALLADIAAAKSGGAAGAAAVD